MLAPYLAPLKPFIAECPIPTYIDADGETHCYFVPLDGVTATYSDATSGCEVMDADATLAVVDSPDVLEHMKTYGIIDRLG